jgi:hypothetical protein
MIGLVAKFAWNDTTRVGNAEERSRIDVRLLGQQH